MALEVVVHALLAFLFLFASYYDLFRVKFPDVFRERNEQSWGRSKFLSFWNLYFQALFFSLSFLNDVLRHFRSRRMPALDKLLDSAFAAIAFPVGAFVATGFSLVLAIDREIAYPLMFDTFIPRWLTFIIQLSVLPAVLVEAVLVNHGYGRHFRCNQLLLALFVALNLVWVIFVGRTCQFYAIPALEPLTVVQQAIAVLVSAAVVQGPFYLGKVVHDAAWGPEVELKATKADKKKKR